MKNQLSITLIMFFPAIYILSGKEPLKCSSSKDGELVFTIPKEYINRKKITAFYVTDSNLSHKWYVSLQGDSPSEIVDVYYGKGWKKADGTFLGLQMYPEKGKAVVLNQNEELSFSVTFIHDTFPFYIGEKSVTWIIIVPNKGNHSEGKEVNEKEYKAWRDSKKK
jgi:hypothetical protein